MIRVVFWIGKKIDYETVVEGGLDVAHGLAYSWIGRFNHKAVIHIRPKDGSSEVKITYEFTQI